MSGERSRQSIMCSVLHHGVNAVSANYGCGFHIERNAPGHPYNLQLTPAAFSTSNQMHREHSVFPDCCCYKK
jgi:hypothetical protein